MIPFVRVRDGEIVEHGFTDEAGFAQMQAESPEYQDIDEEHKKIAPGLLLRKLFDPKMRENINKKKNKNNAP